MNLLTGEINRIPYNVGGTLRSGARMPSDTAPKGEVLGDLWYDTSVLTLKVWNGSTWVPIGGGSSSGLWWYDAANNAVATSISAELLDNTLFLRGANDACHRIKFGSGTVGDIGSMDGAAIMGNSRSGLFADSCTSPKWRLLWDTSGDVVYVRSHVAIAPNGSHFNDPESITLAGNAAGSSSGISMRSRANSAIRWVMYPDSDQLRFWRDGTERVWFLEDGSILTTQWDGNSRTRFGRWIPNGVFGGMFNDIRAGQNNNHYLHMAAANDDNTFITCNSGGSGGAGAVFFRLGNNGTTIMTIGNANQGTGAGNICMGLPNGIAGDTVFRAGGSGQIGINVSSEKHKTAIRTLRETPEPDAGEENPVFKMRPVRFKWKNRNHETNEGLINADEINSRHPNGVAGLIAEEVREICPDAVNVWPAKDEWHWQEGDPLPENDAETGEPILYRPATPEVITSIDNDRMVAYLVDAVQHIKEEHDKLKSDHGKLKEDHAKLQEELKKLKGNKN